MAQADVIREFLVQLGFKTDERSLKKFSDGVEGATRQVAGLVTAIAGSATVAALYKFASNMEAVYFSVQKAGAGAVNLKAFEKAAQNFGASAGEALSSVQSLARMLRQEPGTEGFLASIGIQTRDANGNLRDTTELMADLGNALKNKPYYLAAQYGSMLGISEDTLRAMMNGDFSRELEKQRALLQDSGYDQASKEAHKFMVELREVETKLEAIGVKVGSFALEVVNTLGPMVVPVLKTIARGWEEIYNWTNAGLEKLLEFRSEEQKNRAGENVAKLAAFFGSKEAQEALDFNQRMRGESSQRFASGKIGGLSSPASGSTPQSRLASLEKKYGLPEGLLDRIWETESGRGKHMQSPAGAQGHFQFMPNTAKQYGLADPNDFNQSSDAAARYMRDLMSRYSGNLQKAVAAYNWGPGNVDRNGLGRAPKETLNYIDKVAGSGGVQLSQNTTINVNGGDAAATGRAVAGEQDRVNQNMARNLQASVN